MRTSKLNWKSYGTERIGQLGGLISSIVDLTPGAAWPDEKAPIVGQLGLSSSFLNCDTQTLYKLKGAYDLLEKGLQDFQFDPVFICLWVTLDIIPKNRVELEHSFGIDKPESSPHLHPLTPNP